MRREGTLAGEQPGETKEICCGGGVVVVDCMFVKYNYQNRNRRYMAGPQLISGLEVFNQDLGSSLSYPKFDMCVIENMTVVDHHSVRGLRKLLMAK